MKTFEGEIWTEGSNEPLIYQTDEKSIKDAYKRAMESIEHLNKHGIKCRLIRVQENKLIRRNGRRN